MSSVIPALLRSFLAETGSLIDLLMAQRQLPDSFACRTSPSKITSSGQSVQLEKKKHLLLVDVVINIVENKDNIRSVQRRFS